MSNIIQTYKIQLLRREIHGKFWNIFTSNNLLLDQFIDGYLTPDLINQFLIAEISNVLNGVVSSETIISETMVAAIITSQQTSLYQDPDYDPSSSPDFELPTIDLLGIAQCWLNFVIANPA